LKNREEIKNKGESSVKDVVYPAKNRKEVKDRGI